MLYKLISCRYENLRRIILSDPCLPFGKKASVWWKYICTVGATTNLAYWFIDSISYKLRNGEFIDIWKDIWLGDELLCRLFSSFFQVVDPECSRIMQNRF